MWNWIVSEFEYQPLPMKYVFCCVDNREGFV